MPCCPGFCDCDGTTERATWRLNTGSREPIIFSLRLICSRSLSANSKIESTAIEVQLSIFDLILGEYRTSQTVQFEPTRTAGLHAHEDQQHLLSETQTQNHTIAHHPRRTRRIAIAASVAALTYQARCRTKCKDRARQETRTKTRDCSWRRWQLSWRMAKLWSTCCE